MNTSLRRVGLVLAWLFPLILIANMTFVQAWWSVSLRKNPQNRRALYHEYSEPRGKITAGGTLLAYSDPSDDRFLYLRKYNDPMAYAPITGYYSMMRGKTGLELKENAVLDGTDDRLFSQRLLDFLASHGQRGGMVNTTIDAKLQEVAYQQLSAGCPGGCVGAVVALDPRNGAVLAMASAPSYDPNQLSSHNLDDTSKYYDTLSHDPNRPLVNRAIEEAYPPGSTFKVVTTAAALSYGISPDIRLTAAGSIPLPGTATATIPNYGGETCPDSVGGEVTLRQAFAYSCNTAFVQLMTQKVPNAEAVLRGMATQLQLTDKQAVPMSVVPSQLVSPDEPNLLQKDAAALGQSVIGQRDVRLTPLMNAEITACVANGGFLARPFVVQQEFGPDLKPLGDDQTKRSVLVPAMRPQIAKTLTDLMVEAERRAGGKGKDPKLEIASKTGTADNPNNKSPYSWYVAFAPASHPVIALAVLVEGSDALGAGATGASVAGPIGRAVIAQALADGGQR
ncbi:MAG: penicillin-binding transpeptidase domain-containing protein [Segniliparus sp.]|uniref:penicillin-binding transpeptidase domain-containing protein n=1 Tax=Segniliparus sp. TaxID=2804064 RepID=UPI003F30E837